MTIFPLFFFLGNIGQDIVFYDFLERKIALLGYKNEKLKKSKNWNFSKGVNSWFWSKNGHFSNFFFLSNKGEENIFYDILERKNAFLRYKNKKFKKSKNWNFSKRDKPMVLVQKWPCYEPFCVRQYRPGKWLFNILERKNSFLGYKDKKFKNSTNWHFSEGVNPWYWSRIGHFSDFSS